MDSALGRPSIATDESFPGDDITFDRARLWLLPFRLSSATQASCFSYTFHNLMVLSLVVRSVSELEPCHCLNQRILFIFSSISTDLR